MLSKMCLRCEKKFIPKSNNQKYCKKQCQNKTWSENNISIVRIFRRKYQFLNKGKEEYMERNRVNDKNYKLRNKNNLEYLQKKKVRRNSKRRRKEFCEECYSKNRLELHHPNYESNKGLTLCNPCHLKVHNKKGVFE